MARTGPGETPSSEPSSLEESLRSWGATDGDLVQARKEGWLPLLALDRTLMPGRARYDLDGLATAAGAPREVAAALWRALGFPEVPHGVAVFTDTDAVMLRALLARAEARSGIDDAALARLEEQVRVISGSLARIAILEADEVALAGQALRDQGSSDEEIAILLVDALDWPNLAALVDYAHRIQLRAALWRRLAVPERGPMPELAVAFADIAGYTALSQELDEMQLAELLSRFEARVYDTVVGHGARVVKTIGDAMMFVGVPGAVAMAALDLTEPVGGVPPLRQGVSFGPVLARDGDYFGPTVNLASRLSDVARPSTVLASVALRDALADEPGLRFRALRPRKLRGIGEVPLFVLRRQT